jgi:hypothetical protein
VAVPLATERVGCGQRLVGSTLQQREIEASAPRSICASIARRPSQGRRAAGRTKRMPGLAGGRGDGRFDEGAAMHWISAGRLPGSKATTSPCRAGPSARRAAARSTSRGIESASGWPT